MVFRPLSLSSLYTMYVKPRLETICPSPLSPYRASSLTICDRYLWPDTISCRAIFPRAHTADLITFMPCDFINSDLGQRAAAAATVHLAIYSRATLLFEKRCTRIFAESWLSGKLILFYAGKQTRSGDVIA